MKGTIQEIRITPIAITDPPLLNAAGLHAPWALRTILEVVTDDGITGISEIPGNVETNRALNRIAGRVCGESPHALNRIRQRIEDWIREQPGPDAEQRGDAPWDQRLSVHLFSAVEVACLDIIGKRNGQPVCELLGGRFRDRVPFAAYLFFKEEGAGGRLGFQTDPDAVGWSAVRQLAARSPGEIVRQARAMCSAFGFRSIKLKGGVFEPDREIASLQALHKAFGPGVPLRFDPNAVWRTETAHRHLNELELLLEYLEDPVRGQESMAALRRVSTIPLATNMCTTSFEDLPDSFRLGSEDIILSDHHYWGGLRSSMELVRICRAFGRGLSMHSNSHLGISLAAMVHLGAALPELPFALDTHYPWQSEEVLKGGRLLFEEGAVAVPRGPGLGVEIDPEALQRLHQNYLECGLERRDDEAEMQKIEPGWLFRKTRW